MENVNLLDGKLAAFFTLGCKLNFAETATMARQLESHGVRRVRRGERADICIVNTCSVTEVADHKCRQAIHKLVRQNPGAVVVVTGCYAQLRPADVAAIEGVDIVLPQAEKGRVVERLSELMSGRRQEAASAEPLSSRTTPFVPSCSRGERTRYFLKVQDGCDYYCTYCTIPFARGRSRNGSIDSLVAQAREAAEAGGAR